MTGDPALTAAAEALRKSGLLNNAGYIEGDEERAAESAVRAAGPHILAAERARILAGARGLAFTLWRPGYGSGEAHASAMEVVPLEELLKLIGEGP